VPVDSPESIGTAIDFAHSARRPVVIAGRHSLALTLLVPLSFLPSKRFAFRLALTQSRDSPYAPRSKSHDFSYKKS
jgi:hypothetical protein